MLLYSQSAGIFTLNGVVTIQGCYAGNGVWKNIASSQDVHDHGVLPVGQYTLSPLHHVPHLGPCMALTPDPANKMMGRSGFFVHLENQAKANAKPWISSSDGCIVLANDSFMIGDAKLEALEKLRASGEDQLQVVDLIPDAEWPAVGAGGPITAPPPVSASATDAAVPLKLTTAPAAAPAAAAAAAPAVAATSVQLPAPVPSTVLS
jgi:hypothetical protein